MTSEALGSGHRAVARRDRYAAAQCPVSSAGSEATVRLGDLFLASFTKLTSVQPGERVLDLCARDGAALVAAAERAGDQGECLALDSDAARLETVVEQARRDGLTAVRGEVSDARTLPGPASYWDIVLCHMAFAQLADPVAALVETKRVLRPVGRLGVSSWGTRDRCPLVTVFLDAVAPFSPAARELDRLLFRYAEPGVLATTLADAGFEDATPERFTEWPAFRDVEEYWTTIASDSRFSEIVAGLDPEQVAAAKVTIEQKTRFYRRREGLEIKVEGIVLAAVV